MRTIQFTKNELTFLFISVLKVLASNWTTRLNNHRLLKQSKGLTTSKRLYLKPIRPKGSFLSSQHFGRLNSIIIKELSRTPLNPHEK